MTRLQRYAGQELGPRPHIVVLGSCKVGNFVVSTPVLRGLRQRFPQARIGFIGSEVTADFEEELPELDWRCSWDDQTSGAGLRLQEFIAERRRKFGPIALAINLDGFNSVTCMLVPWLEPNFVAGGSFQSNLHAMLPWGDEPRQRFLADPDWDSSDFAKRYADVFRSNYIAELFCQLAYVAEVVNSSQITLPTREPDFDVPDVLIHCTTARAAKVWPFHHWEAVVRAVSDWGWSIGLVGSPPAAQRLAYNSGDGEDWLLKTTTLIDLRGRTSLIQLAGACRKTRAVVSVDAGPLHIASAVGTPTLAVVGNDVNAVGASPLRLWMPRVENCARTISPYSCNRCSEEHFSNNGCLVEGHPCLETIQPSQVINWLYKLGA